MEDKLTKWVACALIYDNLKEIFSQGQRMNSEKIVVGQMKHVLSDLQIEWIKKLFVRHELSLVIAAN